MLIPVPLPTSPLPISPVAVAALGLEWVAGGPVAAQLVAQWHARLVAQLRRAHLRLICMFDGHGSLVQLRLQLLLLRFVFILLNWLSAYFQLFILRLLLAVRHIELALVSLPLGMRRGFPGQLTTADI